MDDAAILHVLQPEALSVFDLAAKLEYLSKLRSREDGASLADLPIHRFFCESNVGLKFVEVADQVYETRKDEEEKETTCAKLENTFAQLKTCGWLSFPCDDPWKSDDAFKTFIVDLHKALAKYRAAKIRRKACAYTARLQALQAVVFETFRQNFKGVYQERVEQFCEEALLFIEKPDDRTLDLQQMADAFAMGDLKSSPLFIEEELNSEHRAAAHACVKSAIARFEKYVLTFQFATCSRFPKVALLFDAPSEAGAATLHDAVSGLAVSELVELGGEPERAASLIDWVTAALRQVQQERYKKAGEGVLNLIDEQLADAAKHAQMTGDQLDHIVKQVPDSCRDFVRKWFSMSAGLRAPPSAEEQASGRAGMSVAMVQEVSQRIHETLFALPALVGNKEAMEFMDKERVADMQAAIEASFPVWKCAAAKLVHQICQEMEEEAKKLLKSMDKIDFQNEAKMLTQMRKAANSLVDQQKDVEKLRAKAEKAFRTIQQDFEKDSAALAEFVDQVIGASLAAIATFTAISLYRSIDLGKNISANAKANMKKILATTDANKFAVKAERQFGVAAMEEIRTAMKCPLPPPPEPQAEPQATLPEPQAEKVIIKDR